MLMNLIARSARSLVVLMIFLAAAAPHAVFAQAAGGTTQGSFGPGGFLEHPFTMTVQGIGTFITHPITTTGAVLTNIGTAIQNFSSGFTTQGSYGNASLNERQGNSGTNGTANNATPAGPTTVTTGYIVGRTQNNITSGINTFMSNPLGQVTRAIGAVGHVISNTVSGVSRFFGVSNQPPVVGSNGTVYGNNPIGQIHRAIDSVARGADYAVRVLTGTNGNTGGDGKVASPTSKDSGGGSGSGTTGTNPNSSSGGTGSAGAGGQGSANTNVGSGGARAVRQGAVYDGHGNTSVGGVIYSHVGPLSGSESTGGRSENDPIDTGGAGDPNNGAGENNAGMNEN